MEKGNKKQPNDLSIGVEEQPYEVLDFQPLSKRDPLHVRILKGIGLGSLVVGGGILYLVYSVLSWIFTALVGLAVVVYSIKLFMVGNWLLGLVVLLIGTPIATGIAYVAFIPLLLLCIILWIISLFR